MRFKVVPFQDGSQRDDAVLTGIANGFVELYAVPDHPPGVSKLLRGRNRQNDGKAGSGSNPASSSKVLHKA